MSAPIVRAGEASRWAARVYPDRIAAVYRDRRMTYRELDETSDRLANALLDLGLKRGDRVAVLQRNCIESLIVPRAIERAGLTYVRLNWAESPDEWDYVMNHCEAGAMILGEAFVQPWKASSFGQSASRHEIAIPRADAAGALSYEDLIEKASPEPPDVSVGPDHIATISYTSGTTGRPKGVVSTVGARANRLRNAFFNQTTLIDSDDVLASVAPLSHAAGLYANSYALRGAKNVIMDRFDAGETLEAIEREGVTAMFLVATMIVRLIHHPRVREFDLKSLKRIYYGASPISAEVLREAIEIFGGGIFRQQYGATEHPQPISLLQPEDHRLDLGEKGLRRLRSVGRVAIGVELKLVKSSGETAATGEMGEIYVRSDAGMSEYWKDPEATKETIVDGWLRMGDIGEMDEDGYLYIVDRTKDMIISGGFNIYPREVERVIESHAGVAEVCVFGVPDEEWGEAVKAVIRLKPGETLDESAIIEHCRAHLASYKKPRWVEFVEDLPKNQNGKVLKRVLREQHWQGRERKI